MENKEDLITTEDVFCTSCGTKNDNKSNFCLNCGYELKKDLVKNNINNNQQSNVSFNGEDEDVKKKGLFKSGIIQRLAGFIVLFIITVSFIINSGSMVALLGLILLAFFYCSSKFLRDVINVFFEMIGSLVLGAIVFILIIYGICIIPISLSM